MMIEINYMATAAGSFYFLGLFLYYWHVHYSTHANRLLMEYNGFKIYVSVYHMAL
jgi:hypothetical protein